MKRLSTLLAIIAVVLAAFGAYSYTREAGPNANDPALGVDSGIHKIKHVVIIMQENRSFDSYFGTYPHADGIPMTKGVPNVCSPLPRTTDCIKPYLSHLDGKGGGPHVAASARSDENGGAMNGFMATALAGKRGCGASANPNCLNETSGSLTDVMAYHDGTDIPNYWSYARHFVLQDRMFENVASWSLPQHLALVSGWAATCTNGADPKSCTSSLAGVPWWTTPGTTPYAWTDITYLLDKYHVSWGYYLDNGASGIGYGAAPGVPYIWDVLPGFTDVATGGHADNIQNLTNFFAAARSGTLPNVSWIVPQLADSEHPPALVSRGQSYVTNLINTVMRSKDWDSSAIFLSWDDWGGYFDHVDPAKVDANGYGLRVPGLVISPYAKTGYIDHQTLSHDAYLKFIEDAFLNGQRLDPATDGRPDSRPDVRENLKVLGNLIDDFNFKQKPRSPVLLSTEPATTLVEPIIGGGVLPRTACRALTVTSVKGDAITATDETGAIHRIVTTPTTVYLTGLAQPSARGDIAVGGHIIVVNGAIASDGTITATRVRVLKHLPVSCPGATPASVRLIRHPK